MMIIFCACNLGSHSVRVWDKDAWIRWPGEWIVYQDAAILCECEDYAQVAMIAASQGGWD